MASQHSEIKAGAFVAFALALLFVMVFSIGNCSKFIGERQEQLVYFSHVTGLQPNSPVNYAGVEIGRVRQIRITRVDEAMLKTLPKITADNVDRLPLSIEEADALKAAPKTIDELARKKVLGRTIIALSLEISRSRTEIVFHEDDVVRLEAGLMGESKVEVSPGSGAQLPKDMHLLGDGANLLVQVTASVREVKKLLERVSGIIGDEERNNIQATIANVKKVSDNVSQSSETVRKMLDETREPLRVSAADLRATMEEARKTIEEARPLAVAMLESGRNMMKKGEETTTLTAQMLVDAKPSITSLIANSDKAAKATAETLTELEKLLVAAGDTIDESRPAVRKAMLDIRESSRNLRDMTERLKFEPWLLMKSPVKGSQDTLIMEQSARNLASASDNLSMAVAQLKNLSEHPGEAPKDELKRIADLVEQMQNAVKTLESRRDELQKKLKPIDRKGGGQLIQDTREKADMEK